MKTTKKDIKDSIRMLRNECIYHRNRADFSEKDFIARLNDVITQCEPIVSLGEIKMAHIRRITDRVLLIIEKDDRLGFNSHRTAIDDIMLALRNINSTVTNYLIGLDGGSPNLL